MRFALDPTDDAADRELLSWQAENERIAEDAARLARFRTWRVRVAILADAVSLLGRGAAIGYVLWFVVRALRGGS